MQIKRSKTFLKHYSKLPLKIQEKTDAALFVFFGNPLDPILRNHALHGKYEGCRSIDITGDFRMIFRELSDGSYEILELLDIGTHSQLYK